MPPPRPWQHGPVSTRRQLLQSPYLAAASGRTPTRTPVWFMRQAGRYLTAMDTIITLAPLLGLLGTVTGIMGSFSSIGGAELAVEKVTGGIGEALIATAAGLGIAIGTLVPMNYFHSRLAGLKFDLEAAANNVLILAVQHGFDKATPKA